MAALVAGRPQLEVLLFELPHDEGFGPLLVNVEAALGEPVWTEAALLAAI